MLQLFFIVLWISLCTGFALPKRSEDAEPSSITTSYRVYSTATPFKLAYTFQEPPPKDPINGGAVQSCKDFQLQPDLHSIAAQCVQNDQTTYRYTIADLGLCLGNVQSGGFELREMGNFFETCRTCYTTKEPEETIVDGVASSTNDKIYFQCLECRDPVGARTLVSPRINLNNFLSNEDGHLKCLTFLGT